MSYARGWTDTHCHIHDDKMAFSSDESLTRAREAGVDRFVVIGCDTETCSQATSLAFIDAPRVVGIGECGLHYYYEHSPRDVQMRAFAEQIALAHQHDLTLVIHTRDAWQDTFDVLDTEGIPTNTIIHCFTGGPDEARQCLDRGAYLSFSGIVTFKNAVELREAAVLCPEDRILVETDSPFLAPVPHRGRPNEPAHVGIVGTAIADLRGANSQEFAAQTTANALRAFPRIHS